jgi:NADPH:quinone reductase-like Zn-dependent oxidoreductase
MRFGTWAKDTPKERSSSPCEAWECLCGCGVVNSKLKKERALRAFAIDEFGEPGSVREIPNPKPEAGELLVRVEAAGVNVVDNWVMQGALKDVMEHRFPLVLGVEAAGVVETAGSDASGFSEGDRVYGVSIKPFFGSGTFAELATLTSDGVASAPSSVDAVGAAALPHAALTALSAIDVLNPNKGQEILVVGSTGGVGSYVTQLVSRRGASVIAVARAENTDYARSLGAAGTIDYTEGDLLDLMRSSHPDGVDAIVDLFSDVPTLTRLAQLVRPGGHVLSASGGADSELLSQRGIQGANINRASPSRLPELAAMVDEGSLKVPPAHVFELKDAASALTEMESRHVPGKLVIRAG